MPKVEIVNMNFGDTTLVDYPKHWRVLTCCIHDLFYHWCQPNMVSIKHGWLEGKYINGTKNDLIFR